MRTSPPTGCPLPTAAGKSSAAGGHVIHDSLNLSQALPVAATRTVVTVNAAAVFEDAQALIERERPHVVLICGLQEYEPVTVLPDPELEQRLPCRKIRGIGSGRDPHRSVQLAGFSRQGRHPGDGPGVELCFAGQGLRAPATQQRQAARSPLLVRIQGTSLKKQTMSLCSTSGAAGGNCSDGVCCEERQVQEGANQIFLRLYDPQPEEILELAADSASSVHPALAPPRSRTGNLLESSSGSATAVSTRKAKAL